MLRAAGASVRTENAGTPVTIHGELPATRATVEPAERLELGSISVPGDFSSAAFFIVGALLVRGSEVRLEGVGINPGRIGLLGILTRMGAAVEVIEAHGGSEPTATIIARSGPLQGTRVGGGEVPLAIDELPLVALAACFADGDDGGLGGRGAAPQGVGPDRGRGRGARRPRGHDRGDRGRLRGRGRRGLRGGALDAAGDHRLAMLGALAGVASAEGVEVRGMEAAAVSYPGFERDLAALSAN